MPFGELDALYTHIFTSVEDRETVLLILGFQLLPFQDISMTRKWLCNGPTASPLDLHKGVLHKQSYSIPNSIETFRNFCFNHSWTYFFMEISFLGRGG